MKKTIFPTELAYPIALVLMAFGTALTEAADLGMSMVVAPAYLVYLKLSDLLPFFTFGMAEYLFQALLLLAMCVILRRFRLSYLFSFVTVVLYGLCLDGSMLLVALLPCETMLMRILLFGVGVLTVSLAVSLFFRTYIPPEVYELFVKELSEHFGIRLPLFKTVYDCTSCLLAVLLSLLFFGRLQGIGLGTVFTALFNGFLIGRFTSLCDRFFVFEDRLSLKKHFR